MYLLGALANFKRAKISEIKKKPLWKLFLIQIAIYNLRLLQNWFCEGKRFGEIYVMWPPEATLIF